MKKSILILYLGLIIVIGMVIIKRYATGVPDFVTGLGMGIGTGFELLGIIMTLRKYMKMNKQNASK
ncbi:hypothetical protein [Gorillibacterium massiliense]|uniref:hypothetical protein n=1 Tax=Gorillibacterium massiliense TaxID=1280390 RepID=UPI0004B5A6E3|nr:hypothetical protein [Gorillibacterium massiliense]